MAVDVGNAVQRLPHRPPMLMLDSAEPAGEGALVAYQTIPTSGPFVDGHFPGFAVWPGALLVEAMAQTTAVLLLGDRGLAADEVPVLGAADCRFLRPVFPGDRLRFHTELVRRVGDLGLFRVRVERGGELVARGRISAGLTARSALAREGS
ncbi:MAG TPA: 3-hydroxyacyl-ACP dehydratase FabZ family protein [Thermoanaerobaculia bacterium]|nr:3-hydroxyacyl-ACP dehydratase FabZ family protein [Thermoanaerobaculia bacterium]